MIRSAILLQAAFFLTSLGLVAQKTIRLEHQFQPETTYAVDMTMDIDMRMEIETPDDTEQSAGVPDSMLMGMTMQMNAKQTFGALGPNGILTFEMQYDSVSNSMEMNGEPQAIPSEATDQLKTLRIQGSVAKGNMKIDSVSGIAVDSATAEAMKGNLQGMQILIRFPDRPLMVGDTFSQTNNMVTNAGAAGNVAMLVHQLYRLDSWDEEFAYLTITEEYEFNGTTEQAMQMDGQGSGQGRVVFAIKDKMSKIYETDSNMIMEMNMMGILMKSEMQNKILMQNRIIR